MYSNFERKCDLCTTHALGGLIFNKTFLPVKNRKSNRKTSLFFVSPCKISGLDPWEEGNMNMPKGYVYTHGKVRRAQNQLLHGQAT